MSQLRDGIAQALATATDCIQACEPGAKELSSQVPRRLDRPSRFLDAHPGIRKVRRPLMERMSAMAELDDATVDARRRSEATARNLTLPALADLLVTTLSNGRASEAADRFGQLGKPIQPRFDDSHRRRGT
ncbi:hypothetical protein [Methylobacterium sp. A54F]